MPSNDVGAAWRTLERMCTAVGMYAKVTTPDGDGEPYLVRLAPKGAISGEARAVHASGATLPVAICGAVLKLDRDWR